MVLADGTQVTASAEENPDLFWAIRGGGGNFGVVTEFTFQAHPLETIVGGPTFWAIEDSDELLAAYREWLPSAPRNVSGFFNWHTIPPAEPFPEELHMRLVCGIVWCIDASDEDAEKAMAPFLSVAEPLMHGVGRMPIAGLNGAFDGLYGPGDQWYARADFVREIPDEAIELNREWNAKMPDVQVRLAPLPGRRRGARRRARRTRRSRFRDANWSQVFIGVDPDPANAQALKDWTIGYWEALHPYAAGGAYVNFMMDEGQARVKATYGPNYARLARVKATVRPGQRLPGQPEHRPFQLRPPDLRTGPERRARTRGQAP